MKVTFQRDGFAVVVAANGEYAFVIARPADDQDAQYSIQWLEQRGRVQKIDEQIEEKGVMYYAYVNAPWFFMKKGKLFSDWINEPGFKIHSVTSAGDENEDLVRVDYSYLPSNANTTDRQPVQAAHIIFDAANLWAIREIFLQTSWGSTRSTYTYAPPVEGFAAIRELRQTIEGNDGSTLESSVVYDGITYETTPVEQFRLSYYGLPEPNFGTHRLKTWLAYLAAGSACLALAYRRRRRRAVG